MVVQTLVSPEEYLATSYEGTDPELVDGRLVERSLPDDSHSDVQFRLCGFFGELAKSRRLWGRPELRLRVRPDQIRVADMAVFIEKPAAPISDTPPLVVIEIVSPSDTMDGLQRKLDEYTHWGVRHVWVAKPSTGQLFVYAKRSLHDVASFEIPDLDAVVTKAQIFPDADLSPDL